MPTFVTLPDVIAPGNRMTMTASLFIAYPAFRIKSIEEELFACLFVISVLTGEVDQRWFLWL